MPTTLKTVKKCPFCGGRPLTLGAPYLYSVLSCCCAKAHKYWHLKYEPHFDDWISSWNLWVKERKNENY